VKRFLTFLFAVLFLIFLPIAATANDPFGGVVISEVEQAGETESVEITADIIESESDTLVELEEPPFSPLPSMEINYEGEQSVSEDASQQKDQNKQEDKTAKPVAASSEKTQETLTSGVGTAVNAGGDVVSKAPAEAPSENTSEENNGSKIIDKISGQKAPDIDGDNYCGQYAASMILEYYGIEHKAQDIYKQANPGGIFTAPSTLLDSLRKNGIDSSIKHNASLEDIAKKIDNGTPVIVLANAVNFDKPGTDSPHWITIHGYERDENGKIVSVTMRDSYWGYYRNHTMDADEFMKRWNKPCGDSVWANFAGYKNLMIDINGTKKPSKTSSLFGFNPHTAAEEAMAGGINDFWTGWKNKSPTQLLGGTVKIIGGLPGLIPKCIGNQINNASDKLLNSGVDNWKNGNKLVGGFQCATGGLGKATGSVFNTVGNAMSSAANVLGNGIKKIGDLFK